MDTTASTSEWPTQFSAHRARFRLFGNTFRIFEGKRLVLFVKQRAFKLKEDIIAYTDPRKTEPRLRIRARAILDFSAIYDVQDARTGEAMGALQRLGVRSLFRDTWNILDVRDQVIGQVIEDSGFLAILRRIIPMLIPQAFDIRLGEHTVGRIRQRFNIFRLVYDVRVQPTNNVHLDPRLAVAASILLLAIDGRQR
jgi:hypothetical protein